MICYKLAPHACWCGRTLRCINVVWGVHRYCAKHGDAWPSRPRRRRKK